MSVDEDTELRDLVAQTLESNGILDKIRAELRANVFLALEEQESLKNGNLVNKKLSKFLNTKEGSLAASLVLDFLKCFHLDFTLAVFNPESGHANKFETRDELAKTLKLNVDFKESPLIVELMRQSQQDGGANKVTQGKNAKEKSEDSLSYSPRSPTKIPLRIDSKGKKDNNFISNENSDRSIDSSFGNDKDASDKILKEQKSKVNSKRHDDEDNELLAELGLSKESNKKPLMANSWVHDDIKGKVNDKVDRHTLGSLKDAPPLPGIGVKKNSKDDLDFNSSGDWRDLAAIEEKISKLGFAQPHLMEIHYIMFGWFHTPHFCRGELK
eukprot:gene92-696_t